MEKALQEKYKQIAHEVDVDLSDIFDEFTKAIKLLSNDGRFMRTRLLMSFSLLEVICNLYNNYYQLGLSNKQLLPQWIDKYCFTEKNDTFKNHPYLKIITIEHLYKFRNSIVHSFALPDIESGLSINIPNGSESAEIIKRYEEEFKKLGHKVAFISADSLTRLFLDGYKILHLEIFRPPQIATEEELNGMDRVWKEFIRRGGKLVPLR